MFRKGQISMIIIMVLILVMIVGVFYYLKTSQFESTTRHEEAKMQLTAAKLQPVREYVDSCIELSIKEGLELLGMQGGYIYRSQGGMLSDPGLPDLNRLYSNFEDYKVRYAIFTPRSDVGTLFFAIPPLYPWPEFPYDTPSSTPTGGITGSQIVGTGTQVIGGSSATSLTITPPMLLRGYYGTNQLKPLLKPLPESIQEQLEFYVVNSTLECLDWAIFETQGLDFELEEMNVSLMIAENDLVFTIDFPIKIIDRATEATSSLEDFVVTHPIRLKNIYEFIRYIIDEDVTDINFSITGFTSDGLSASIQPSYVNEDDLIIITDEKSKLFGQTYEFRLMRHNRPPALFYISGEMIEEKIVNNGARIMFDPETRLLSIINPVGDYDPEESPSFDIQLDAMDPDEDNLTFSFIPNLPYNVSDSYVTQLSILIKVEDGEKMDRQEIIFEAETIRPAASE